MSANASVLSKIRWITRDLVTYWRTATLLVVPILLSPVVVCWTSVPPQISRCAYVALLMAVYWVTEVVPVAVTALLPVFAFPMLGVQEAKDVAISYLPDVSFLIVGGLMVAIAIEQVNLHRRIALLVLRLMGSQLRWIMLGIMLTTAILSAFISNTATTAMMTPIVIKLSQEIIKTQRQTSSVAVETGSNVPMLQMPTRDGDGGAKRVNSSAGAVDQKASGESNALIKDDLSPLEHGMVKLLLLSVCYSASIGGTATLTGTAPNLIMTQILNDEYGSHPINYASWLGFNCPGMFLNLFLAWAWLQLYFLGPKAFFDCKKPGTSQVKQIIKTELDKLGRLDWAELSVIVHFLLLLLLWLLRGPLWGRLFMFDTDRQFVSDGTSAILVSFLLFLWPKQCPDFLCLRGDESKQRAPMLREGVLTWEAVEKKFPWGIVIFLGGSFALGKGMASSGLSAFIGEQIKALNVNDLLLCFLAMLLTTSLTEFTSNTATSTILIPIILTVAQSRCINPLYLTLPVARTASFAFTLPIATPPNAIVYQTGLLKIRDMILVGVVMNLICMCEVLFSLHTWGMVMFGLDAWPQWAGNNTAC